MLMDSDRPRAHRLMSRWVALALLASGSFIGCGDSGRVPVYPVRGKVTLDGKPAVGAYIKFIAVNPNEKTKWMIPKGIVDSAGNYRLDTYVTGDGAPEGEYGVTINWPTPEEDTEPNTFPDVWEEVRDKYADRKNPQLHAVVQLSTDNEDEEITIPTFELSVDEYFEDDPDE